MDDKILKIMEEIVLEKISKKETISYSELAKEINKKLKKKAIPEEGRSLGTVLSKYLHKLCYKSFCEKKIMIGAIVVRKDTGIPSNGLFKFAEKLYNLEFETEEEKKNFWSLEIKKVFKEEI